MPTPLVLPEGYTSRQFTMSDAPAVFELMAACELADLGSVEIELADITSDWTSSSYSFDDGIGVYAGDELVAYTERMRRDRGDGAVHPDHRGRGLGTALAGWLAQRAAEYGDPAIGIPYPVDSAGDRLLAELGWQPRWNSWILALPAGAQIEARALPDGYQIRAAEPSDYESAWHVVEDAFLEWSERDKEPYDDWAHAIFERDGFEPWQLRVALDDSATVVGAAVLIMADEGRDGYIDKLAVRGDQRNRGLAQALLADAFAIAREHGAVTSTLSTDSRTGALSLYEKVGMVITSNWVNRAITL